jgi:C4-dicarboxylate-specific signal transduction histidine kinase
MRLEETRAVRPTDVRPIREAVEAAQRFAHGTTLDGCDAGDIDEISASLAHELERPLPNAKTLATYMNSLLRSLRPQHHAAQIISQLHDVMDKAGIHIEL